MIKAPAQAAMAEYRRELEKLAPEMKREVAITHAFEQLCMLEPEYAGEARIPGASRAMLDLAISALAGAIRPLPYERPEVWEQAMHARRMLQRVQTVEEKQLRAAFLLEFLANSPVLDWRFLGAQLLRHIELATGARRRCSVEAALGKANLALEIWSPSSGARLVRPKRRWEALNDLLRVYDLSEQDGEALRATVSRVARAR